MTYQQLRKSLLSEIVIARREYFRLKSEIEALNPVIPQGCYISRYTSNYRWQYNFLGHKDAVLPSAKDKYKLTRKLHLGYYHNPNYRAAVLELEKARIFGIKLDTLNCISNHLFELKFLWKYLYKNRDRIIDFKSDEGKLLTDFVASTGESSVFGFIVNQHKSHS